MPVAWSISHPSRLVTVVVKQEFRPADLILVLAAIDAAKANSYRKLIDVTRLAVKVPMGILRELARVVRRRESERVVGPIAIVAGVGAAVRQATYFADEAQGERLIQIFPDQAGARAWLNSFYAFEGERLQPRS